MEGFESAGFGFRVSRFCLGFRLHGLGFRVQGLGFTSFGGLGPCKVWGLGFRAEGSRAFSA